MLAVLVANLILSVPPAFADEISVNLFGQPCAMKGPFARAILEQVHSVGPEELLPGLEPIISSTTVDRALGRLEKSARLPDGLARYTERSIKRFRALRDYFAAIAGKSSALSAEKNSIRAFVSATETNLSSASAEKKGQWPTMVRRYLAPAHGKDRILEPELRTFYLQAIEPDPEEEFHQAIQKLGIQYTCNFDPGNSKGEAKP